MYVSNPTWANHKPIFAKGGLTSHDYRYYDAATRGLDFDGLMADINAMPSGAIILLHACAHNPTGVDPSMAQWRDIGNAVKVCKGNKPKKNKKKKKKERKERKKKKKKEQREKNVQRADGVHS